MVNLVFCERCGRVAFEAFQPDDAPNHCIACHHLVRLFELSTTQWFGMSEEEQKAYLDTHIIQDSETKYFESLREKKAKEIVERIDNSNKPNSVFNTRSTNIPHCPICNSTDLKKLSAVGKVAKISFFGIFGAGDIGKTYKCNNCGSKF